LHKPITEILFTNISHDFKYYEQWGKSYIGVDAASLQI